MRKNERKRWTGSERKSKHLGERERERVRKRVRERERQRERDRDGQWDGETNAQGGWRKKEVAS